MNIKTIGTVTLMAAMDIVVGVPAAHAYTVTVSDTLLANNGVFDACVGDASCATSIGTFDAMSNSGFYSGGVSIPGEHLAPSPSGAYAYADASGFVLHANQEMTAIEFNWGSWDYDPVTGSGTNIFAAGSTLITGAVLAGAFPFAGQRDVSIIITGLTPFTEATWSNYPASIFEFNSVDVVGAAPATPELSTWAMMLVGFAGLGYAARRRVAQRLAS